ncbi:kinase-like protein [Suillus brevipes Sb2]|nr:kinase-like protein [Suillus brevipes Sb2]
MSPKLCISNWALSPSSQLPPPICQDSNNFIEWANVHLQYEHNPQKADVTETIHIKTPSSKTSSGELSQGETFGVVEQKVATDLGPLLGKRVIRLDAKVRRGSPNNRSAKLPILPFQILVYTSKGNIAAIGIYLQSCGLMLDHPSDPYDISRLMKYHYCNPHAPFHPEKTRASSHSSQDLTNEPQGRSRYPIASGGFGDIWKCDLVKADGIVQVAVKTTRAFESDNEVLMRKNSKRVRRELKVWGRLKHDCILPLWGVATEFGPYPAMLNDIALGLQYLHSESVVYGDLTGSNVLIYGNGRACLADFGLSTIILEFVGTSYFTSSIRGNVRWVAAELCEVSGDEELELSAECDIYSFGSITLQVLTCKVPYYNVKKDIAVLGQVMKGMKPEPPKESQIAPGHWEFIQRC